MRNLILFLIKIYQKLISPDHGGVLSYFKPIGVCKFRPTCSDYCFQAIEKYGILKGGWLGLKRVVKCNPFSGCNYDSVK